VISKDVQTHLVEWTPSPVTSWVSSFKFVMGETPLSEWYWPIGLCAGYLVSLYFLSKWMENKKPFDLFHFRVLHNAFLAYASLMMLVGCMKEAIVIAQHGGIEGLFCDSANFQVTTSANLWYYLFYVSKFYEFIDTYILILRKKQLSFLHVFHHFITAILCWAGLVGTLPMQWLTLVLNTGVHVAMYYYYLTQTLGGDVWWKKYLTSAQIVQFIIDIALIQLFWYYELGQGLKCHGDWKVTIFADAVLGSFLLLFLSFYSQTYSKKERTD